MKFSIPVRISTLAVLGSDAVWRCSAIPPNLLRSLGAGDLRFGPSHRPRARRLDGNQEEEGPGECRLPKDATDADGGEAAGANLFAGAEGGPPAGDKRLQVCDVLGGLDVVRLRSLDTRALFAGAVEDAELVREYLAEALSNGAREGVDVLGALSASLDVDARNAAMGSNLTAGDTTVAAGLAWVDDRPGRRVDRFVSESNMPHSGDKVSRAAKAGVAPN